MLKNKAINKMTRGERIAAFRGWLNMTQSEFAAELGLRSHTSVVNFEKHNVLPPRKVVTRLVELAQRTGYPHITRELFLYDE